MKRTPLILRILLGVLLCTLAVIAYALPGLSKGESAALIALGQRGSEYVFGEEGPEVFDCSGLVRYSYAAVGTTVIHSAQFIGYDDSYEKIDDVRDLRVGDLIFFNTIADHDECDHVGIWLGGNRFVQASSSEGKVIVSRYDASWKDSFSWGRRVLTGYGCELLNRIESYLPIV